MSGLFLRNLVFVFLILLSSSLSAETVKSVYIGSDIPVVIKTNSRIIFQNSDSLKLNGRILTRCDEYAFNIDSAGFVLSEIKFGNNDTLVVSYRSAPRWLMTSFGEAIPDIATPVNASVQSSIPSAPPRLQSSNLSDIDISGTKTFRFSSQTSGTSDFGQSLDLNIEGKLTEDLRITGTISDRGYNPSYGTANSRLEELDKVNISLLSKTFTAQVGDIQLSRGHFQNNNVNKNISGALVNVNSGNFGFNGVAARPKGRFKTFKFVGVDGIQGPYQIGQGSRARPVVPNSETVWLDGRQLKRGTDNDYLMDYPTGRITFSVKNLIDRRSRIEIDYEPISTDYKTELISAGSNYKIGDSSFYAAVEWYREGDDKKQLQTGTITDIDRALLNSVGDDIESAVRSGIKPDTNGSYIFDPTALPDTVLQYVGEGNGDYSVIFSFVGAQKGDYKFAGGQQYVHSGTNGGDYLPIIKFPSPQRTDFYNSVFGFNNSIVGSVNAELSVSQFDKNLFSSIDDGDNEGILLNLDAKKEFKTNNQLSRLFLKLRTKEADYYSRNRLNSADFERAYLIPQNYTAATDEKLYEAKTEMSFFENVTIVPSVGRLNYQNSFLSDRYEIATILGARDKLNGSVSWKSVNTNYNSNTIRGGRAGTLFGRIAAPLFKKYKWSAEIEKDNRNNNYTGVESRLEYIRYLSTIDNTTETITYENYAEDSISQNWSEHSTRNRLSGSSIRRVGMFSYNVYLGYQWLTRFNSKEQSFLGKTDFRYNNSRKQLNIESSYALSEETRNARGITYLEVEPGQGSYIFENGRYFPDPDGNFIQVEELLSDRSRVNRGDKSFLFSKRWEGVQIRFNSRIEEELLEEGSRNVFWLVPFLSDDSQPYLVYNRQYNSEMRFFSIKGGHAVNISLDERTEFRNFSGSNRVRRDRNGNLSLKQVSGDFYLEEKLKVFLSDRDNYFIGAGDIDGYQVGGNLRRLVKSNEFGVGGYFRKAQSVLDEISKTVAVTGETRFRVIEKGEIRNNLELYSQSLLNINGIPSYVLTDNKRGSKGILWSSSFNYSVRQGMRINLRLSGRHSDETTARITGRGEVVAEF